MSDKLLLTVSETARFLGVSRPTVYRLIHADGFPVFDVCGLKRVSSEGLRRWVLEQSGVQSDG